MKVRVTGGMKMEVLKVISEALQKGNAKLVEIKTEEAVEMGISIEQILNEGLLSGMNILGKKFRNNEVYVPEVLVAAHAMHIGLEVLQPMMTEADRKPIAKVVLGTVKGDVHDIGKNIVKMMMIAAGLEVIDVGADVPKEKFIDAIKTYQPQILALSALLTTTMPELKAVIDEVDKNGLREQVKIMVGGAPLNEVYARQIGADGYAPDGGGAAELARNLVIK